MTVAELTVPTLGPEFKAKLAGTCKRCSTPIVPGEDYVRSAGAAGFMHALCAVEYVHVLEEHNVAGGDADEESR